MFLLQEPCIICLVEVWAASPEAATGSNDCVNTRFTAFSKLLGAQPTDSSKIFRNYRVGDGPLVADLNGHRTVYSAFQYVLLLTAGINSQELPSRPMAPAGAWVLVATSRTTQKSRKSEVKRDLGSSLRWDLTSG